MRAPEAVAEPLLWDIAGRRTVARCAAKKNNGIATRSHCSGQEPSRSVPHDHDDTDGRNAKSSQQARNGFPLTELDRTAADDAFGGGVNTHGD